MDSKTQRELEVIKAAQEMAERRLQEMAQEIVEVIGRQSAQDLSQLNEAIGNLVQRESKQLAEELWKAEMLKVNGFQA